VKNKEADDDFVRIVLYILPNDVHCFVHICVYRTSFGGAPPKRTFLWTRYLLQTTTTNQQKKSTSFQQTNSRWMNAPSERTTPSTIRFVLARVAIILILLLNNFSSNINYGQASVERQVNALLIFVEVIDRHVIGILHSNYLSMMAGQPYSRRCMLASCRSRSGSLNTSLYKIIHQKFADRINETSYV